MKLFFELVKFEYKKIFMRKLVIISIISYFIFLIIINNASLFDKKPNSNKVSGYYVNTENMLKASNLIKEGLKDKNNLEIDSESKKVYFKDEAKEKFEYPYLETTYFIRYILNPKGATSDRKYFLDFTNSDFDNIYNKRNILLTENLNNLIENKNLTEIQKSKILELNSKINIPFYFENFDMYEKLLKNMSTNIIFIFLIIICAISPIFSNDHTKKTYPIIYSSKYGRTKLINAKLFTAFTFSIILYILSMLINFINTGVILGFSGFKTSLQFLDILNPYPFTIGEIYVINLFIFLLCILLVTSLVFLISIYAKTNFLSISISFSIIYLPIFLDVLKFIYPKNILLNIVKNFVMLSPINTLDFLSLYTINMPIIFNKTYPLYIVLPSIYIPLIIILIIIIKKYCKL